MQYHFVQCIKYRRKVLIDEKIIDLLRTKINEISKTFRVDVLNMECDKDHFHLLFKAKPTLDIPKYLNAVKTISSREIRRKFPKIKKKLWEDTFWSRSYFLATTGQVTLDQLKKYVESQNATNSTN
ncbi:MAG: IS200/IS605 family transposase [Candidatus Hydromicrobium sp.]|nr:IS200/IS605 family transposase [Candidatus Hydromicrobium sp.]